MTGPIDPLPDGSAPTPEGQRLASFAGMLVQAHGRGSLIFWTADEGVQVDGQADWRATYGVACERKSPEIVTVYVRDLGPGSLEFVSPMN
jgi:hypothetical protein